MGFGIILEDLHFCLVKNLLPNFTMVNFRKSDIYPDKGGRFHWDTETEVF